MSHDRHKNSSDYTLLYKSVERDGLSIASARLLGIEIDPSLAQAAVLQNPDAILFVPEHLKTAKLLKIALQGYEIPHRTANRPSKFIKPDKLLLKQKVQDLETGKVLAKNFATATTEQKQNKHLVMGTVQEYTTAIKHAHPTMKDDKDIALVAVGKFRNALRHFSGRIRNDFEVVKAAVTHDGRALRFASPRLQRNFAICKLAYSLHLDKPSVLKYIDPSIREDIKIACINLRETKKPTILLNQPFTKQKNPLFQLQFPQKPKELKPENLGNQSTAKNHPKPHCYLRTNNNFSFKVMAFCTAMGISAAAVGILMLAGTLAAPLGIAASLTGFGLASAGFFAQKTYEATKTMDPVTNPHLVAVI